ncbi:hypothetical protein B9Z55_011689 [Caenorhabditis nigoni]|uniref:Skp1-related protein n=1 Tax=Caenorhabditis nigoni TaxID=1611254 RepID=A0A2G5UL95_9PELO|nr:hypothetical protein B9Z55_011689 [Caenorhabditis nigoni]
MEEKKAKCEITLKFRDDSIVVKDARIIKKMDLVNRAITSELPNWETEDTIFTLDSELPFLKAFGVFMISNILKYRPPPADDFTTTADKYPEANALDLEQLKTIIELANYTESMDFMNSIGFVIAKKLDNLEVDQIAEFFGVDCKDDEDFFDENDGWTHPKAEMFKRLNPEQAKEQEK